MTVHEGNTQRFDREVLRMVSERKPQLSTRVSNCRRLLCSTNVSVCVIPSWLKGKLYESKTELKQGDSAKSSSIPFLLYKPRDEGNFEEG
jgi:hypothetical protein